MREISDGSIVKRDAVDIQNDSPAWIGCQYRFQLANPEACFRPVGTLFNDAAYRLVVLGNCSQNDHCVCEPCLIFH